MDVSRSLTIVTSEINPSVTVYACYWLTLLVSTFYLGELYICASLLVTSFPGDCMCNWWPLMAKEYELSSQCLWVIICTSEVIVYKTRLQVLVSYGFRTFKEIHG